MCVRSVRARTFCECFSLHPDDMQPVLKMHPGLKRRLSHYTQMKQLMEEHMSQVHSSRASFVYTCRRLIDLSLPRCLQDIWMEEMKGRLHSAADKVGGWASLFASMNSSSSGEIDLKEWRTAVRKAGVAEEDVDDTAIRKMFIVIDEDGGGTIDIQELVEFLESKVMEDDPVTRMLMFHKEIDDDLKNDKIALKDWFDKHAVDGHVVMGERKSLCEGFRSCIYMPAID